MNNNTFVIFSSINWKEHSQLHHQLTRSLLEEGYQVLFIENTGVRTLRFSDFWRVVNWLKSRLSSFHGFSQDERSLVVHSPLFIPLPFNRIAFKVNAFLLNRAIEKWKSALKISQISVISFLPTPSVQLAIKKSNPDLAIYYCADDMSRSSTYKRPVKEFEKVFFQTVDLVLVTSNQLKSYAEQYSSSVHLFSCGVDIDTFSPKNANKKVELPDTLIVGYIGAIGAVFDQELVYKLANSLPHVSICLVGPLCTKVDKLKFLDNVYFFGAKNHEEMPSYIHNFDLTLIPYVVNKTTNSVYPCKLNEYLAMGKPVVSTQIDEIVAFNKNYGEIIQIGSDHQAFISHVADALEDSNSKINNQVLIQRRVSVAKDNAWITRFKGIKNLIESVPQKARQREVIWHNEIRKVFYSNALRNWTSLMFVLYLIAFHTPAFSLLGEGLIVRDKAAQSDAIVIFSGTGEGGYRNDSYQKRALDAVRFYKEGYASKIVLSSGREQTIPEVEIMRLFIQSNGIPVSDIYILKQYPSSTYSNVILVNKLLDNLDITSLILVTSPYHSLRSKLIWQKNIKNKTVIIPEVVDTPDRAIGWGIDYKSFKLIIYEYTAIVNNWIKGWL